MVMWEVESRPHQIYGAIRQIWAYAVARGQTLTLKQTPASVVLNAYQGAATDTTRRAF
ncbi:hypothetical protein ACLOJK_026506 [Asimina triloba]